MSRWFRFYDEALNDPKVQRLTGEQFKVWVNFLCLASKGDGLVLRADVTFGLRFTDEKDANFFIDKLIELDLIEDRGDVLAPHNWRKRQYKSDVSTARVKQFRKRQRNVSEAPPEQSRTETDSEQKEDAVPPTAQLIDLKPPPTEESQLFDRGRQILKTSSGGVIKQLVNAKGGNVALARAALEMASTKSNPREYLMAIIRGRDAPDDLRARGRAW